MRVIREAFLSSQSNQFLITGNVHDLYRCPWLSREAADSAANYIPLSDYLEKRLAMSRRIVLTYNIAHGVQFAHNEDRDQARAIYLSLFHGPTEMAAGQMSFDEVISRSAGSVFPALVLLRRLCEASTRLPGEPGCSIAIVVEHAESILPDLPAAQMNDADRQRLIFFREWLTDPAFTASDHLLLLIAETASAVNSSIRSLPQLLHTTIPLPNEDERRRYIRWVLHTHPDLKLDGSRRSFAQLSAGMPLTALQQVIRLARYQSGRLQRRDFLTHLNRFLANKIGDHIEIVRPDHTLDDVVGNTALKAQLIRLQRLLRTGDPKVAPVGILMAGPNGVGKTFIATAWAAACERVVIVLKNLRGSLFGQTDQIFEKIRGVLEVLGNVIVIVDEADTVFARPGANVHEAEQRLFGNVIRMMGSPANRGRIVWILMTARPDNLAPDMKRSGRCGLHLPVFDPEGQDRIDFVNHVLTSSRLSLDDATDEQREDFLRQTAEFSPADFNELQVELRGETALAKRALTMQDVVRVATDCNPGTISGERRLQALQAVLHCSRQSLVPDALRDFEREEILAQVRRLRLRLGEQ